MNRKILFANLMVTLFFLNVNSVLAANKINTNEQVDIESVEADKIFKIVKLKGSGVFVYGLLIGLITLLVS